MRDHGGWIGEEDYYTAWCDHSHTLERQIRCTHNFHVHDIVEVEEVGTVAALDSVAEKLKQALADFNKLAKVVNDDFAAARAQLQVSLICGLLYNSLSSLFAA
jgi:hypothetical protein